MSPLDFLPTDSGVRIARVDRSRDNYENGRVLGFHNMLICVITFENDETALDII